MKFDSIFHVSGRFLPVLIALSICWGCSESAPPSKPSPKPPEKAVSPSSAAESPSKDDDFNIRDMAEKKMSFPEKTPPSAAENQPETPAPGNVQAGEKEGTAPETEEPAGESSAPKLPDLGPPLVDNMDGLKKLDPIYPVWIDAEHKQIILVGTACKADYPLEFFATYADRGYESVVVIYAKPSIVHAGLLALGAKPGKPVEYEPQYSPPTGAEVEIEVAWKDQNGRRQKARAQNWVRDIKTKQPLDVNWVFTGSMFWEDKTTGEKSYLADRGDFISVLNLPTALLDVPIKSGSAIESRLFEGFTEHLPPPGTPVTLILTPKLEK